MLTFLITVIIGVIVMVSMHRISPFNEFFEFVASLSIISRIFFGFLFGLGFGISIVLSVEIFLLSYPEIVATVEAIEINERTLVSFQKVLGTHDDFYVGKSDFGEGVVYVYWVASKNGFPIQREVKEKYAEVRKWENDRAVVRAAEERWVFPRWTQLWFGMEEKRTKSSKLVFYLPTQSFVQEIPDY